MDLSNQTSKIDVKLVVSFHKKCDVCPYMKIIPDIYVPILGGRVDVSKDVDLFIPGMLTDDVGENISWLNFYLNEITCLYWVWKHPEALGNPSWIGSQHYRRFFHMDTLAQHLRKTILVAKEELFLPTYDFLTVYHDLGQFITYIAESTILKELPGDAKTHFKDYMNSGIQYSRNLFLCPWEVFDILMTLISHVIFKTCHHIFYDYEGLYPGRNMSFVLERFTGFFFYYIQQHGYSVTPVKFGMFEPDKAKQAPPSIKPEGY